ncbi:MAG: GNAT family N-acetyltransferase [candidate division Zixibacteria bacterium]|nr:GNAT family N-acetyltransferase [candidate division Zixibacteria bacterium]
MIDIRRYHAEDEQGVRDLISQIMAEEFREDQEAYPLDDVEDIERTYGGLGEAFFVAAADRKIVGTVAIKKENERVALLRRLFVSVPYRKQRLGLKLIDFALAFCDKVGYDEIVFKTTSRMKAAIQVCRKRGFAPRAKLQLGNIELMKFARSVRDGKKVKSS